jgi:hypothetical protein
MTPNQQLSQLERELHAAKITYLMHDATGQRPQATFRYAEGHGPTLSFTATIRNGALQLLVGDLSPPSDPFSAASSVCALNASWGVGQACYVDQRRSYRLTSAYPVFARGQRPPLLPLLIANLYNVGATLLLPSDSAWSDAYKAADAMRLVFPRCDIAAVMQAMELAVRGMGHPFQRVGDVNLRQLFRGPDGNAFIVTIAPRDARFIRVETRTAIGRHERELDQLNQTAPIGCFVPGNIAAETVHGWEFAEDFIEVTERLAAWLIEVAAQMSAAARRIPPPASAPRASDVS